MGKSSLIEKYGELIYLVCGFVVGFLIVFAFCNATLNVLIRLAMCFVFSAITIYCALKVIDSLFYSFEKSEIVAWRIFWFIVGMFTGLITSFIIIFVV